MPEQAVRAAVTSLRRRYRVGPKALPGSPDLANASGRWAVFVHGCYWHQHPGCRRATVPARNREWWVAKFEANRARDARKVEELKALGFRVLVVWECETRGGDALRDRIAGWFASFDG